MEKRHSSLPGNPVGISIENPGSIPPHEIGDMLFDNIPENIFIKNGRSSLRIPNETLEAISLLPPKIKGRVMEEMLQAIKDSSFLIIIIEPEK